MYLLNGELPWLTSSAVTNRAVRLNFKETRDLKNCKAPRELWASYSIDLPGMYLDEAFSLHLCISLIVHVSNTVAMRVYYIIILYNHDHAFGSPPFLDYS